MEASTSKSRASRLKKAFSVSREFAPCFTGHASQSAIAADGTTLYAVVGDETVRATALATGEEIARIEGDSTVTALACTSTALAIARRSLALSFHTLPSTTEHMSVARAHDAPITIIVADGTGTLFASGSADGTIKVWDAARGHCTHVFRPHATGVVSALHFDVAEGRSRARLISGAEDGKVRVWDLRTRKCLHVLDSHVSVIRGLACTDDGATIVSGSRDRVVNVWDASKGSLVRTIPVLETLEAVGLIEVAEATSGKGKGKAKEPSLLVYTAGDSGRVRLWDVQTGQQVHKREEDEASKVEILDVLPLPALSAIAVVHSDQNIRLHSFSALRQLGTDPQIDGRLIVGYNDEIIDLAYLTPEETHLALATNSSQIRVVELDGAFDRTQLLSGHTDVVLALARSLDGATLMSGSKDNTARLWRADDDGMWRFVGTCSGHLESVGAVALARSNSDHGLPKFAATASQDTMIKLWNLGEDSPKALFTQKIHDKDINSLDIAPNDRLLASGSQDKTAKLFTIEHKGSTATLTLAGVFKGHRRGVWSVKFSRTDQALCTASGDRTVKIWNIHDFTCLKTFEGHTNSVLRADFISSGLQLVSAGSDGLVKVWNIRDEDCAATLDNHEEKVWALAISKDEKSVVSGAGDSVVTFWSDVTAEQVAEQESKAEQLVLKNQDYENHVAARDYRGAILLALEMDQPRRLHNLLTSVHDSRFRPTNPEGPSTIMGSKAVDTVIESLQGADLFRLLEFVRDWNTSARTSDIAQTVLFAILKTHSVDQILKLEPPKTGKKRTGGITELVDALIPYTERHYQRIDRLLMQESSIVDYTLSAMNVAAGEDDMDFDAPLPVAQIAGR